MIKRKNATFWALTWTLATVGTAGCGVRPRFMTLGHAAPIVRARSATQGDHLPDESVIPALIARLNDPDSVVRLSAHQALRKRTGQDFGFVPWADEAERAKSIARWQSWWKDRASKVPQVPRAN